MKLGNWVYYSTLGKIQTVEGISSKVDRDRHIVLWDFDNCSLERVRSSLESAQKTFNLGEITVFSDKPMSYRAVCYSQVSFRGLMEILISTKGVDDVFIVMTARKGQATLRLSPKVGRLDPEIVLRINGDYVNPPDKLSRWVYETGYDSRVIKLDRA
jgi:hypothetical protein